MICDLTAVVSDNFPLGKLFVPRTCCVLIYPVSLSFSPIKSNNDICWIGF